MAVKKCCIKTCNSSSARHEDQGVTYHKFPKLATLQAKWIDITQYQPNTENPSYVCSRHFCKKDFQKNKESKYVLKSDAVPSIFPWTAQINMDASMNMSIDDLSTISTNEDAHNISNTSKSSDENVEAIRNYIEQQERELAENSKSTEIPKENESQSSSKESQDDTMIVAESVMDMILQQSEQKILESEKLEVKKDNKNEEVKPSILTITSHKGSITVEVGTKVETQDFEGEWYPAEVQEIDLEEVEVLVRYSGDSKKTDEWISANSTRLRQYTGEKPIPRELEIKEEPPEIVEVKEEPFEVKEEVKPLFVEGERCLARWRDNKRFMATVNKALDNGQYEITFDDGFVWTCGISRLHKWKPTIKSEGLSIDVTQSPAIGPNVGPHSPVYGAGPSAVQSPAYHTHLFDPTRDYLSSKSERREMKRKLNIKEIFNIGQKKPKVQKEKVVKPKVPVEKKPKPVKKSVKKKPTKVQVKTEGSVEKAEIPDAVASIIGTVKEEPTIKTEPDEVPAGQSSNVFQDTEINSMEVDNIEEDDAKSQDKTELSSESDPVLEEDVVLENFDQTENDGHERVLDQIKEAINKLEHGLNEIEKSEAPKVVLETTNRPVTSDIHDIKGEIAEVKEETPKQKVETLQEKVEIPVVLLERPLVKLEKPIVKLERPKTPKIKLELTKLPSETKVSPETLKSESLAEHILLEMKPETETVPEALDIAEETELIAATDIPMEIETEVVVVDPTERPKKVKKAKKIRLLKEKKKSQVDIVRTELEQMKRQFEEMRKQMLLRTQELENKQLTEMPESFLLPGEWCCKWVNGQPVGKVSEIEAEVKVDANNKPVLPRRSVEVVDKRLPPGWTKHMVRRSVGHSAGKWDVVLVSPQNKRFHTKTDMRHFFENYPDDSLKPYENALFDFGVHLKLSRRMGWIQNTPDGIAEAPATILPAGSETGHSPLVKRKKPLSLKKKKDRRRPIKMKLQRGLHSKTYNSEIINNELAAAARSMDFGEQVPEESPMPCEDGYVWCGSLKVQVIDTLLRCPAEGCFKNFRNTTLLQMHIKHYHREMRKQLGATPKVLDLAYARTKPILAEQARIDSKVLKVKIPKPSKRLETEPETDLHVDVTPTTPNEEPQTTPKSQDSPKLRHALNKPVKRPRVLLPVRRVEPELAIPDSLNNEFENLEPNVDIPLPDLSLDFETAISTHTVTKPLEKKKKGDKKQKSFAQFSKTVSEDEEWFAMNSDDVETRSSFPRSGTPDSKVMEAKMALMSSESNEEQRDPNAYAYTESERIKIVHMKREEIINCHCGIREEDGLMVQCELCLCWQHALCHNIQREAEVPEKYTCSICLNPRRGRRSKRFLHDQDRMYEGLLPGGTACSTLRRSHELSGNLLRIQDALHALRVKYYVATKKDHPKLYLWAKDWEAAEITYTQERLNSDYSDLSIMINGIGKENMPVKEDVNMPLDITSSPSDNHDLDRFSQRDSQLGSQSLLSGLLSSPGGGSLDLPITTSELERLASSVQAEEAGDWQRSLAPQPEAAIENSACRERLLRHVQRAQALVDTRLDSIEAQLAELESQDPSFGEFYETAEFYPRTKQTIQMLMRDLDTMEELGVIT